MIWCVFVFIVCICVSVFECLCVFVICCSVVFSVVVWGVLVKCNTLIVVCGVVLCYNMMSITQYRSMYVQYMHLYKTVSIIAIKFMNAKCYYFV